MDRTGEERILRRAIAKGLISERDVPSPTEAQTANTGRWGARIERLLDSGRLDEIAVAAIAEEVARLAPEEVAPTLDSRPGPAIDTAALQTWDQFEIVSLLGAGGGGEVFRARDRRLGREVALKFLHADRADLAARFRREAQAQARIEHAHVCKVFEVGEVRGRSYIAMQLIEGQTLGSAAAGMTLEEKVRIMRQVAEAAHAAHQLSIVHRDLKPGNVMVRRTADGQWQPFVVDFGLARELDRSLTSTATMAGTPAFMAPEQARGEAVDRRCDVYGLGATLFALLANRPPFIGSSADVLVQLMSQDAPPLRRVVSTLPVDLETIVATCLESDPSRRYDSARALAEDLQRYLDGEPIAARPLGRAARTLRRMRRHRTLVAFSSTALLALLAIGALWLRSALGARHQAHLAQQFGREAHAIENLMRVAHLLPAHDIRPEKARVVDRMNGLEQSLAHAGDAALGPGHYALGRGALALGDLGSARTHLERAWQSGYQSPEVAYSLGQVLGEQYEQAFGEAGALETKELRDQRRHALAIELREPALRYLRAGRAAAMETPAFVEGLIAFREEHFEQALERLSQAGRDVPSLYEARRLTGDVLTRMAFLRQDSGKVDEAQRLATRAAEAYRAAGEIGRSDESIHLGECKLRFETILMDWDRGRALDRSADEALAACDRALAINPDSAPAYRQQTAIGWREAEVQIIQGKDPRPTLARAVARANEALQRDPKDHEAMTNLGIAWLTQADHFEIRNNIDPAPSLKYAIDSFGRSIAIHPTADALSDLGAAHSALADWEAMHGRDPRPHWQPAIASYQRAIALSPKLSNAHMNLGVVYAGLADYELNHGVDPRHSVDEAVAALQKAIDVKPNNFMAWSNLGSAWGFRAEWERAQGIDCRPSSEQRLRCYRKGIELKPDYIYTYDNCANAWHLLGLQALDRGLDPSEFVNEGRAVLAAARKFNAEDKYNYQFVARIELIAARAAQRGTAAPAGFTNALGAIAHALRIDPKDAESNQIEAEIHRWQAERMRLLGQSPSIEIGRGLESASRALSVNPKLAGALAVKGALLRLRAQQQQAPERDEADAKEQLRLALQINPLLKRDYPEP